MFLYTTTIGKCLVFQESSTVCSWSPICRKKISLYDTYHITVMIYSELIYQCFSKQEPDNKHSIKLKGFAPLPLPSQHQFASPFHIIIIPAVDTFARIRINICMKPYLRHVPLYVRGPVPQSMVDSSIGLAVGLLEVQTKLSFVFLEKRRFPTPNVHQNGSLNGTIMQHRIQNMAHRI